MDSDIDAGVRPNTIFNFIYLYNPTIHTNNPK